jgi:hypothetical protein
MSALPTINPNTSLRGVVVSLPKPAKPRPDVEAMALKYGQDKFNEGFQRAVDQRSRHPAYDDLGNEPPDFEPLRDELESLDVAAYSLGEILETTTGVLLVLSRLQKVIAAMGPEEARAVARFADAVKGAQS